MCRLFGFRSVILSQVHHSLVNADNALSFQSVKHPDGWGVAYYVAGAPHIIKSSTQAANDNLFQKVSGIVSSETVVAHLRKATLGEINLLNTHPFQYGSWVFAHNGNIKDFDKYKEQLKGLIAPRLKRFVLGNTDSEILFYLILTNLSSFIILERNNCPISTLMEAVKITIEQITSIVGDYTHKDDDPPEETFLSFIITNGVTMLAHQGGKRVLYSTYKNKCAERDTCPSFSDACENETLNGHVNHLIFSSEPLSGENIWTELKIGQMIGVDWQMKLTIS